MPKGNKCCYYYFLGSFSLSSRKKNNTSGILPMTSSRKERLKKVGGLCLSQHKSQPPWGGSNTEPQEKFSFMNRTKEKSHSKCFLASSGRGETMLEETFEAERLCGLKVGKDFSPYRPYYKNFQQKRNEMWAAIVFQFQQKVEIENECPWSSKLRLSCLMIEGNQGDISMTHVRLFFFFPLKVNLPGDTLWIVTQRAAMLWKETPWLSL